jgi:predicted Zn-dependent peptidase
VGGKHNAFTGKEYTGYWVKVASRNMELALDVVSDLLLTPKLREKDIAREKGVIVEEINMYEDNPQYKVSSLFDQLVYEGSPLAGDPAGTKKTVTSLKHKDFLRHYDRWYGPENVVIGLVGGINEALYSKPKLKKLVAEYFSKGEERQGGGEQVYGVPRQTSPRLNVFYKDTEQAHFYLGFPGLGRTDEDRYALSVLTTILGGNSSSRLFNEIREKRGLAYYAYASMDAYHETGSMYALEGVSIGKIEEAIKVTLSEFERAKQGGGLTERKVNQAKEYLIGKTTLDLEDSASMANFMVRKLLLEGKLEGIDEVLSRLKKVTLEDVKRVADRIIDFEAVNLAVVGPYKNSGSFGKLIGVEVAKSG